jgi:hypothetical protein
MKPDVRAKAEGKRNNQRVIDAFAEVMTGDAIESGQASRTPGLPHVLREGVALGRPDWRIYSEPKEQELRRAIVLSVIYSAIEALV